ncbi:hypothetical protein OAJ07_01810 [Gemmatimonadales bacterium]|jgi:hypothetical protein|nr:hypothetical protein [Gemmatimonadales bacterium]
MRGVVFALNALSVIAILTVPVEAQLRVGGNVATVSGFDRASDLNGTFGVGGRLGIELPVFPVGLYGSITHYFPDGAEVRYWTASVFGKLGLPIPVVSLYGISGIQRRARTLSGVTDSGNGFFVGLGLEVGALFLEGAAGFNADNPALSDLDNDPLTFKGGFIIG